MDVIKSAVKLRMSHICAQIWEKIIYIQSIVNPFDQIPCRKSMPQIIWPGFSASPKPAAFPAVPKLRCHPPSVIRFVSVLKKPCTFTCQFIVFPAQVKHIPGHDDMAVLMFLSFSYVDISGIKIYITAPEA